MKRIILFLSLLLASLGGQSQLMLTGIGRESNTLQWPTPVPLGEIVNFDFTNAANLNDFTIVNPASTISLSGGYLRLNNNPGSGGFGNYIQYNTYGSSALRYFEYETVVIPRDKTNETYGVTLGTVNTNTSAPNALFGFFALFDGGGYVQIYLNGIALSAQSPTLAYSINDRIKLTFERNEIVYTITAANLTTLSSTVTVSYTVTTDNTGETVNSTCKPAIYSNGGTQDVEYLVISSTEWKNPRVAFVGNSITYAYSATELDSTWSRSLMSGSLNKYAVCASPGDKTQDVLNRMSELLLINPQYVCLMVGGNDILFGVPTATWQSNMTSIIYQLENNGSTVLLLYATPRDATNVTSVNTFIDTKPNLKINTFTPLSDGGTGLNAPYDSGDGVHPNDAGHRIIRNTVLAAAGNLIYDP